MSSEDLAKSKSDLIKIPEAHIADFILRSNAPIEIKDTELISMHNGESGMLLNKEDFINWHGEIPISEYPLNEDPNPEIIHKKPDQTIIYNQEVSIRYLRPPTPPPPGDIIIKQEKSGVNIQPAPPLVIRQQPPRPETPAPLILREMPPKQPKVEGTKIIKISPKQMPPPPRKVIIERLPPIPPKPQNVIIERWLPYREQKRRVIFQNIDEPLFNKQKNVIIQWDTPNIEIRKEFKDLGIVRANPVEYIQRFGTSLKESIEMPEFVKEIKTPSGLTLASESDSEQISELEGDIYALSLIDLDKEGLSNYKKISNKYKGMNNAKLVFELVYPLSEYNNEYQTMSKIDLVKKAIKDMNNDKEYLSNEEARITLLHISEKMGRSFNEQDEEFLLNLDKNRNGAINCDDFNHAVLSYY